MALKVIMENYNNESDDETAISQENSPCLLRIKPSPYAKGTRPKTLFAAYVSAASTSITDSIAPSTATLDIKHATIGYASSFECCIHAMGPDVIWCTAEYNENDYKDKNSDANGEQRFTAVTKLNCAPYLAIVESRASSSFDSTVVVRQPPEVSQRAKLITITEINTVPSPGRHLLADNPISVPYVKPSNASPPYAWSGISVEQTSSDVGYKIRKLEHDGEIPSLVSTRFTPVHGEEASTIDKYPILLMDTTSCSTQDFDEEQTVLCTLHDLIENVEVEILREYAIAMRDSMEVNTSDTTPSISITVADTHPNHYRLTNAVLRDAGLHLNDRVHQERTIHGIKESKLECDRNCQSTAQTIVSDSKRITHDTDSVNTSLIQRLSTIKESSAHVHTGTASKEAEAHTGDELEELSKLKAELEKQLHELNSGNSSDAELNKAGRQEEVTKQRGFPDRALTEKTNIFTSIMNAVAHSSKLHSSHVDMLREEQDCTKTICYTASDAHIDELRSLAVSCKRQNEEATLCMKNNQKNPINLEEYRKRRQSDPEAKKKINLDDYVKRRMSDTGAFSTSPVPSGGVKLTMFGTHSSIMETLQSCVQATNMKLTTQHTHHGSHCSGPFGASKLLTALDERRQKRQGCDIVIQVENRKFAAHRFVVTAMCPYFHQMFIAQPTTTHANIDFICNGTMATLLDFMYTGEIMISSENVEELLEAACRLRMEVLKTMCAEYLIHHYLNHRRWHHWDQILRAGHRYRCQALIRAAERCRHRDLGNIGRANTECTLARAEAVKPRHQLYAITHMANSKNCYTNARKSGVIEDRSVRQASNQQELIQATADNCHVEQPSAHSAFDCTIRVEHGSDQNVTIS